MEVFEHGFGPIIDENSKILILGSFPSVKSREKSFYYMHPQNRFWKVLEILFQKEIPASIEQKIRFLKYEKIALYDVVKKCQIKGSMDSDLKVIELVDINKLIEKTNIDMIFANGTKAFDLAVKQVSYCKKLPSTSPANARYKLEDLCQAWREILDYV